VSQGGEGGAGLGAGGLAGEGVQGVEEVEVGKAGEAGEGYVWTPARFAAHGYRPLRYRRAYLSNVCVVAPARRLGVGRRQGLTLVHISAQLKRILWDRVALRGRLGDV